ncbi:PQQ-binding-like beta-propeller repeat protein [Saccharibacillus sacchari]|uniref:PQQ-binding-like beta-propeller repeat protein n=1 Tax=Saccharibacillus sacchari TaxID=456493 RepID=A0ACC6P692_9BACL
MTDLQPKNSPNAAFKNKQNLRKTKLLALPAKRFAIALCVPFLLVPATFTPAYAAATTQQQNENGSENKTTLYLPAPYFKTVPNAQDRSSLGVSYYGETGSILNVTDVSGELLQLRTSFGEQVYVPIWYTENQSADTESIQPVILRLKPDAALHLFPGSESVWSADYAASGAISAVQSGDWYGISLPADPGYANGSVVRPALLWVEKSQIQSTQKPVSGLLSADSTVPTAMVRSLTETSLQIGTTQAQTLELLGEPYSRTPLPYSETQTENSKGERGEKWRYERSDAQLTLSFGVDGKLLGWNWILPTSEAAQAGVNSNQPPYAFRYDFRTLPPVASASPELLWQSESKLDAQYLLAASEKVLVLQEDDGYVSGNHLEGGIYAVDRTSGERLWSRDAGYGSVHTLISHDERSALVFTESDPQKDEKPMLRSIRLRDGAVRWSREIEQAETNLTDSNPLFAADTSVVIAVQPNETGKGLLTVRSQQSGSVRWTKEFADPYQVLNQGSNDPYVLIRQGRWIQALDPNSGQAVWSLKSDENTVADPQSTSGLFNGQLASPFDTDPSLRWVALGKDHVRLNASTGEITGRYPILENEQVDVLGNDYLLIRRALNASTYSSGSLFETVLYDVKLKRELWSIAGQADRPLLNQDRVFVLWNGIPAALSIEDGQPLWKTETAEFALGNLGGSAASGSFLRFEDTLLLPYGPDLLAIDAQTGKLLRRIDGVSTLYNESNTQLMRNHFLNSDNHTIYVGSANGSFSAISFEALSRALHGEESTPSAD